ncbi:MAG: hypothetical protein MUF81_09725 [Verrucomicrobia bacterium]|jgi:hypothetical protein|nr:hypothetical protein [Verrucomicrobiota bacterium]
MSINPETDLDLEKLFLPAWAQETSPTNRYAKFTGQEGAPRGERRGDDRGGPSRGAGPRREGGGGFGGARRDDRPRGPRREGGPGRPQRDDRGGPRRDDRREPRAPEMPLPDLNVAIVPDERGVESLARQIKMTGRAYPLFGIALLILQKPERYSVRFAVKKNAEGQPVQPLFVCALDETLWLNENEVVEHVLRKHFATFYQAERTATEPPKGTYTFVGQCGLSGVILGPPNHHDYQNQLRKLHAGRFARMPFEMFKARVKIVRDEAVVKQWVEEQSWKTEYICLNVPEPLRVASRADVEQHFRATHKETIIKPVESQVVSGVACRSLRGGLGLLVQDLLADQRRFPMQVATGLSQQFAQRGLQFFKVNKTVTHVSVARPQFLDLEATPVSEGVRRIVEFINAHPKCSRRKLFEALAPSPAPAPIPVVPAEGEAATKPAEPVAPTPEQTAVIADLHWLVHQGHVLEFASGMMETAKKPLPRPPKPQAKTAEKPAESDTDALAAAPVEAVVAVAVSNEAGEAAAEPGAEAAPPVAAETTATEPAATVPPETAPEEPKV